MISKYLYRVFVVGGLALLVAGCVQTTNPTPPMLHAPRGASAKQALESFAITIAIADVISSNCRSYGIRKNYRDTDSITRTYIMTLVQQGYNPQELERAASHISRDVNATVGKAIRYLTQRGARQNDAASLCRVGQREISAGTSVGRLLRN